MFLQNAREELSNPPKFPWAAAFQEAAVLMLVVAGLNLLV